MSIELYSFQRLFLAIHLLLTMADKGVIIVPTSELGKMRLRQREWLLLGSNLMSLHLAICFSRLNPT